MRPPSACRPRRPLRRGTPGPRAASVHRYCAVHNKLRLQSTPEPHGPGESPRRGGGPPLSVGYPRRRRGCAEKAERLAAPLQARGPSPRTKRSGRICSPTSGQLSKHGVPGIPIAEFDPEVLPRSGCRTRCAQPAILAVTAGEVKPPEPRLTGGPEPAPGRPAILH